MAEKKFELGDYIEVKDRIARFYELYGKGSLVTDEVTFPDAGDNKPRVMVKALAYRTPDDPHPGVGYSWLELPGKTPYTNGSEIENAETSAWGRAIGSLGILISGSIATSNEIQNKAVGTAGSGDVTVGNVTIQPSPELTPDGGLIGTAFAQGNQDFNLRQSPEGWSLPFRVGSKSKSYIVLAENDLANALDLMKLRVIDKRVTVWGHWSNETTAAKGTKPEIRYKILHLSRLQTSEFTLPMDEPVLPEPPADVPLVGEAESAPLFDELPV